jgi:hypothetical protein
MFVFVLSDPSESPASYLSGEGLIFGMTKVLGKNTILKGLWFMYTPCTTMGTPRNNVRNIVPRQNLIEDLWKKGGTIPPLFCGGAIFLKASVFGIFFHVA